MNNKIKNYLKGIDCINAFYDVDYANFLARLTMIEDINNTTIEILLLLLASTNFNTCIINIRQEKLAEILKVSKRTIEKEMEKLKDVKIISYKDNRWFLHLDALYGETTLKRFLRKDYIEED